jgi:hypothetical protein
VTVLHVCWSRGSRLRSTDSVRRTAGIESSDYWGEDLLLITLALLDIAGDFVTQGTLSITITISILVALALFPLSLRHWRVQSEFTWEGA